jgi:hypothetical protein
MLAGGSGGGGMEPKCWLQYISSALSIYLERPLRGRPEFDSFAMGGGPHSAPFGMAMNPKRQVRAAHGRARAAKTH